MLFQTDFINDLFISTNECVTNYSENHLFVAYFTSTCKVLLKDKSDFYHKDLSRVKQRQNLALC